MKSENPTDLVEKQCDSLLCSLFELEGQVAGRDVKFYDDPEGADQCRNAIEDIRRRIDSFKSFVDECLRNADEVCQTGADVLSPAEFHGLRKRRDQLRDMFYSLEQHCRVVSDRLDVAAQLLRQVQAETVHLDRWISDVDQQLTRIQAESGDTRHLRNVQAKVTELNRQISSRDSDVDSIQSKMARIYDEFRGYVKEINGLRNSRKLSLRDEWQACELDAKLKTLGEQYEQLQRRCDQVQRSTSNVEQCVSRYRSQLANARNSMDTFATTTDANLESTDPDDIRPKLDKMRALNSELIEQHALVETAATSGRMLLDSIQGTDGYDQLKQQLNDETEQLERRYTEIAERMQNQTDNLNTLHTQSQGVYANIDDMLHWMVDREDALSKVRQLPLDDGQLQEESKKQQLCHADIASRKSTLDQLTHQVHQLDLANPSTVNNSYTNDNLVDFEKRHRKLAQLCNVWGDSVRDARKIFNDFHLETVEFNRNLQIIVDESGQNPTDKTQQVEFLQRMLADLDQSLSTLKRMGASLIDLPNSTGHVNVRNKLADIEKRFSTVQKTVVELKTVNDTVQENVSCLVGEISHTHADIASSFTSDALQSPVGNELSQVASQIDTLALFNVSLQPLSERVDDLLHRGRTMVKKPGSGAVSFNLDSQVNNLDKAWNALKEKVDERDSKLADALHNLDNYNETLKTLFAWLDETEKMIANQRPPAADEKVLEAQLQGHDVIMKHVDEKQSSLDGFFTMIDQSDGPIDDSVQNSQLMDEADLLLSRYNNLVELANDRRDSLLEAHRLAEKWTSSMRPIVEWLDAAEKKLKLLGNVATDRERLLIQLERQRKLQHELDSHRPDFDALLHLCPQLAELVSVDDAVNLEDTLTTVINRYDHLGTRCQECGHLLEDMTKGIDLFLTRTEKLGDWLDDSEQRLDQLRTMALSPDQLHDQSIALMTLAEDVAEQQEKVTVVIDEGRQLCRHACGDEALALQTKLEHLRQRYSELSICIDHRLETMQEALPLVEQFHDDQLSIFEWLDAIESDLNRFDEAPVTIQSQLIDNMEEDVGKWRPDVTQLNTVCTRLAQLSPGNDADRLQMDTAELNRRFDAVCDYVQRRIERLDLSKERQREVQDDLDKLLDWFSRAEDRMIGIGAAVADPEAIKVQLKSQRLLNDDIVAQRSLVRQLLSNAKKLARDFTNADEDAHLLQGQIDMARDLTETVSQLSQSRLSVLEQALPLGQDFADSWDDLNEWLTGLEIELENCPAVTRSGHDPEHMGRQQTHNNELILAVNTQKPMIDKLEKTASCLASLCTAEEAVGIQDLQNQLRSRYSDLRDQLRCRGLALDEALHESSQFVDQLGMMLVKLETTADQVRNPEPIAVHPDRIRAQIADNCTLMDELQRKAGALHNVKVSALELAVQTHDKDPAVVEIAKKIDLLDCLWEEILCGAEQRGRTLEDTLTVAQTFWNELNSCTDVLDRLRRRIEQGHTVANGPVETIEEQQRNFEMIQSDLHETAPLINSVRKVGDQLSTLIDPQERPEIEHLVDQMDTCWNTVTELYHKRHADLIEAMDKAMDFHQLFDDLFKWLIEAGQQLDNMGPVNVGNLAEIHEELDRIDQFKQQVDDRSVGKEQLNQKAVDLCQLTKTDQSNSVRRPIADLNSRWNALNSTLNDRQHKLERALLEMGQFQQAYDQLLAWIDKTTTTLDDIVTIGMGDLKSTEIQLAKYRVVHNDVHAHQSSVDTLNIAAKRMIAADSDCAADTLLKMDTLDGKWRHLQTKTMDKLVALETAKKNAETFDGKLEHWLVWLDDLESAISGSKPPGGLVDTALQQLDDYSVLQAELAEQQPHLLAVLCEGDDFLDESPVNVDTETGRRLVKLRHKWDQMQTKLTDRRTKLDIALHDAEHFHQLSANFEEWLTQVEQQLTGFPQVSRLVDSIAVQMDGHRVFQHNVQQQRTAMTDMSNKGSKLQYYCEKKDAVPIKNLLVSAKHRYDKVVTRTMERTRQLDVGFQKISDCVQLCTDLNTWLDETGHRLQDQTVQTANPERIGDLLDKHKHLQTKLTDRQLQYDDSMRRCRRLKDHAPKHEAGPIQLMSDQLRLKWTQVCSRAVDRQRILEEALLLSGQFTEAVVVLVTWLNSQALPFLSDDQPVHGDLDTVNELADHYKCFKTDLQCRQANVLTVRKAAEELLVTGDGESAVDIQRQVTEMNELWDRTIERCELYGRRLDGALDEAQQFHNMAHTLLEWLADMELKLRLVAILSDDAFELEDQLNRANVLTEQFTSKKTLLNEALAIGTDIQAKCHPRAEQAIKHWLCILQSRWDEVASCHQQRNDRLAVQLQSVRDQDILIGQLLEWIESKELALQTAQQTRPAKDLPLVEQLIGRHEQFQSELRSRQKDVDEATKGRKLSEKSSNNIRKNHTLKPSKSQQLSDRWGNLWLQSLERHRKLQDLLAYLQELKRLENFVFDDWKHRYMDWTDGYKSRVSDFFRRIGRSSTGLVPRQDFINGILASKFPTTRLEMDKVADLFDNGDGLINSKDFMSALRYDGRPKTPGKAMTDIEKINHEVERQAILCNCPKKYTIKEVDSGRYKFGDNQIKRLVRMLRSTVMVRVGGGWESLDEFLVNHDPCRAKGRTNLELRDKYIVPVGASDEMHLFEKSRTPRALPMSMSVPVSSSTPGPIVKVREKTERSVPMHHRVPTVNGSPSLVLTMDSEVSTLTTTATGSAGSGSPHDSRSLSRSSEASESSTSLPIEKPTRIPSLRGRKSGHSYRSSPQTTAK